MNVSEINAGQILVSNTQWGPTYALVTGQDSNDFYDCFLKAVKLNVVGVDAGRESIQIHSVGTADMKGIGWKIPTADELRRMERWIAE